MKIDRRKRYFIMLDTETCNTLINAKGRLDMSSVLAYDIGWIVADTKGNIYRERSFVNYDIFSYEHDLMHSSYYADKISRYIADINLQHREICTMWDIRRIMLEDMKEFNTYIVCAHNAPFDIKALNNTVRYVSKSLVRYWFPWDLNIEVWDTLKMARSLLYRNNNYRAFCNDNNFLTAHSTPRPQLKAEVLYKYITRELDFEESHTGLEDALIEIKIYDYCRRKKKKMDKVVYPRREENQ